MSDIARIAVLEAKQDRIEADIKELMATIKEQNIFLRKHMEEEEKRWEEIHGVIIKWKGVVGGMFMLASAIWGVFVFAADFIHKWLR